MRFDHWWHRKALRSAVRVSGVRAIYLNNLLRGLGYSMVGIFFPIYVFLWGFERGGLGLGLKTLLFSVALERLGVVLLAIPLGKLVYKIGFKYSILISAIATSTWFIIPSIFPRSLGVIIALALVSAIEIPIYWLARLSIMSLDGEKDGYGAEVSLLSLIDQASSILGPFVGGILLAANGFGLLFTVSTFICMLSTIPVFFISDYRIKDGISLKGFFEWLSDKSQRHIHIASFGQGWANFVDAYFWPLFIFVIIGSFTVLGTITSITFALSSVAIFIAGKMFDKKRAMGGMEDEHEYTLATILLSLITVVRPILSSISSLFGLDAFFRIVLPFWGVGYESYLYTAGSKARSALEFFTYREIVYSAARVIGPAILLIFVGTSYFWWATFALGSIGTVATLGMQKES